MTHQVADMVANYDLATQLPLLVHGAVLGDAVEPQDEEEHARGSLDQPPQKDAPPLALEPLIPDLDAEG